MMFDYIYPTKRVNNLELVLNLFQKEPVKSITGPVKI